MSEHPSFHGRLRRAETAAAKQPATAGPAADTTTRRYGDRACCCLARPAVIAELPPGGERVAATDLLLCGHHFRVSKAALAAASATILDLSGHRIEGVDWPADHV